jgi:hypothetical protein
MGREAVGKSRASGQQQPPEPEAALPPAPEGWPRGRGEGEPEGRELRGGPTPPFVVYRDAAGVAHPAVLHAMDPDDADPDAESWVTPFYLDLSSLAPSGGVVRARRGRGPNQWQPWAEHWEDRA